MKRQVWYIDEEGYFTGSIAFTNIIPVNATTIPLVDFFVRPLLREGVWVEGATEEEIAEYYAKQSTVNYIVEDGSMSPRENF